MSSPPIPAVSRGDARSRTAVWVVVAVVGALGAASLAWIYGSHLSDGPPIRTDGAGYYVYLPAVFIDHDLTLRRTLDRRYGGPQALRGSVTRPLLRLGIAFTTFLSLHAMIGYWRGSIPFDGTDWHTYAGSFLDLWPW